MHQNAPPTPLLKVRSHQNKIPRMNQHAPVLSLSTKYQPSPSRHSFPHQKSCECIKMCHPPFLTAMQNSIELCHAPESRWASISWTIVHLSLQGKNLLHPTYCTPLVFRYKIVPISTRQILHRDSYIMDLASKSHCEISLLEIPLPTCVESCAC